MNFITSCFIRKNTFELRKKLEDLGYKLLKDDNIISGVAIITYEDPDFYYIVSKVDKVVKHGRIDCGTDEDLFLAVAALCKSGWYLLPQGKSFKVFRESSLEELIEHFKEKYPCLASARLRKG